MKRLILTVMMAATALTACSGDDGESTDPCGEGDAVAQDGVTYCVFDQELIIEGFRCPLERPHRFDGPDGDVVCSPEENLGDDELDGIIERWNPQENVGPNVGTGDAGNVDPNGDPGSCITDEDCPEGERCGATNVCERPIPPQMCEGVTRFDDGTISVGDEALVIDWTCPVTQCCGDGVFIASCPQMGGDYVCVDDPEFYTCAAWDETATAGCPVFRGVQGDQCAWSLEDDACADGFYCDIASVPGNPIFAGDDNRGTCQPLPAICNADACYEHSDCGATRNRCYGADARNGVLGVCREAPAAVPSCLDGSDCPDTWECVNSTIACEDACGCADPAAPDTFGTCEKVNGGSAPGLWLRNGDEGLTWSSTLEIFWAKGEIGTDANWVTCPSYYVEFAEPQAAYTTIGQETCAPGEEGTLRRLDPGTLLELPPFDLSTVSTGTAGKIRLRGAYYAECTGATTGTCNGPFERFSPAQYAVSP